ncbi:hypothetical protein N9L19_00895 [bacterium]|nr:hypothetical protein [bacterium]
MISDAIEARVLNITAVFASMAPLNRRLRARGLFAEGAQVISHRAISLAPSRCNITCSFFQRLNVLKDRNLKSVLESAEDVVVHPFLPVLHLARDLDAKLIVFNCVATCDCLFARCAQAMLLKEAADVTGNRAIRAFTTVEAIAAQCPVNQRGQTRFGLLFVLTGAL